MRVPGAIGDTTATAARRWLFVVAALNLVLDAGPARAQEEPSPTAPLAYSVETVALPEGIRPEVSALTFDHRGRLVVCFRLGSIWIRDDGDRWSRFAAGLFWPLGVLAEKDGEVIVAQIPELTRIADTDGDGVADLYETICDDWGLSGNYHEFVSGPVRDAEGNFFVGLGCASSGGPLRPPFRGSPAAGKRDSKVYGHHSPVPYRGWIVRVRPDGTMEPWATGFRQPNGLVLLPNGELFAADNQGDWIGCSPLHHVERGAFHGHPAGLAWERSSDEPGTADDVRSLDRGAPNPRTLERRRKPPALLFPQNDLAGSIAQPVVVPPEGFGPYAGQLIVSEWSHPRLHRVDLERVDGVYQGACFSFLEGHGLRRGTQRLAFAPDGSLYLGQVSRLWGGTGEGLQRVVWSSRSPLDILRMRVRPDGFRLTFTEPLDRTAAENTEHYAVQRYRYKYHSTYGSPKVDVAPVRVVSVSLSTDGREVILTLGTLEPGFVYDLRPRGIRGAGGAPLATRLAAYTVNRLPREN